MVKNSISPELFLISIIIASIMSKYIINGTILELTFDHKENVLLTGN